MIKIFSDKAWDDYLYWQQKDKKMLKKINRLIEDIERNPFKGLGKPEPLKHGLSGFWSRQIDREHRLVYRVSKDKLEIAQCRTHYE